MENEEYTSDELEEFCQELTTMKFLQKSFYLLIGQISWIDLFKVPVHLFDFWRHQKFSLQQQPLLFFCQLLSILFHKPVEIIHYWIMLHLIYCINNTLYILVSCDELSN